LIKSVLPVPVQRYGEVVLVWLSKLECYDSWYLGLDSKV